MGNEGKLAFPALSIRAVSCHIDWRFLSTTLFSSLDRANRLWGSKDERTDCTSPAIPVPVLPKAVQETGARAATRADSHQRGALPVSMWQGVSTRVENIQPYKAFQLLTTHSDLLRRHEKSAHNIDTTRRKRNSIYGTNAVGGQSSATRRDSRTADWNQADPVPLEGTLSDVRHSTTQNQDTVISHTIEAAAPLSAADHNSHGNANLSFLGENNSLNIGQRLNGDTVQINGFQLSDQIYSMDTMAFGEPGADPFDLFGDDTFLENVDFSSLFLPAGFGLDSDMQLGDQSLRNNNVVQNTTADHSLRARTPGANDGIIDQSNSISRFGSPLPSIRADSKIAKPPGKLHPSFDRPIPCWKISKSEYDAIAKNLEPLRPALPPEFSLPSRHTASRYLEGCIRGLYEHMPFLHIPTWNVATAAPDLVLSMLAVGCQFRFEPKAITLFYAAKAAITFQIGMKDAKVVGAYSRRPNNRTKRDGAPGTTPNGQLSHGDAAGFDSDSRDPIDIDRLQTMQATMNLMVLSSWGPKQLVGEAIAFQSVLAGLVREDGLGPERNPPIQVPLGRPDREAWLDWIRTESLRRTKMFVYTFTSLQSVAYNVSPCVLTNEVQINTPAGQDVWNAKTVEAWTTALSTTKIVSTSFTSAYQSLFQPEGTAQFPPSSAIAIYALIFGILNCIFLLRESRTNLPYGSHTENLRPEDVENLSNALQRWQARWENSPESSVEPISISGPVAFNSTALLRLAWIRLHADLGPCRNLASRDPNLIVEAFKSCPPLHRHAGLSFAIVQAAHALSIPVRLGIAYVAKTQTLSWSVQHSLCNLECAIFVSKWFDTVASTIETTPLTTSEVGLIHMFRSIVQETGFFKDEAFEPAGDVKGWQRLITHLGTAVAMLWAEIFSGHHVFDSVDCIGNSLAIYAKHLEDAHTPINAG